MIYINTVQTNQPMKEIKTERDFVFFKLVDMADRLSRNLSQVG